MSKTIGIIALKGGVGKTSTVANLGASLASDFKKKVLLIDGNFSTPHLGLHTGLLNPNKTIHHVLSSEMNPFEAVHESPAGFHIIPGAMNSWEVNPLLLKEKINALKENYDYILIDSSPSLNDELYSTMNASDEIYVVTSPDYPTITSTLHAIKIAKDKGFPISGLIINRFRNKKFEINPKLIQKTSGIKIAGIIPEEEKVLEALSAMTPVTVYSPRRKVSKSYRNLAKVLMGRKKSVGFLNKILNP